tara:strand:- start:4650 stop:5423 length:774 start_codon:yes stop_codon:yes gene_type:complete
MFKQIYISFFRKAFILYFWFPTILLGSLYPIPEIYSSENRDNKKDMNLKIEKNDKNLNYYTLTKDLEPYLFNILATADHVNSPKKYLNQDGSIYYIYKKNKFAKNLSPAKIKQIINNPPNLKKYRDYISSVLSVIRDLNIEVRIKTSGHYSAQWLPMLSIVQINSDAFSQGTIEFAKLLNHESIHIAQSCKAGGLNYKPQLIGLKSEINNKIQYYLSHKIYKNISLYERNLEVEAYSNQDDLKLGIVLIKKYCNSSL